MKQMKQMKHKNRFLSNIKAPLGLLLALAAASQTSCGSTHRSPADDSETNEAIKTNMRSYYGWVYSDLGDAGAKLQKINKVEPFLLQNDIFRLSEEQLSSYLTTCENEGVPANICQDLLEIHRFYKTQEEAKKSHKDKCHGLTCGVSAL